VYLLKHTTRTVTAEVSHGLVLNQIAAVALSTSRPLVFDRYSENRVTGSFILIDPATSFTAGAGMITGFSQQAEAQGRRTAAGAATRIAKLAREAPSTQDAVDAVRRALEEMLT
jgi:sulfate adenylyltransferase subunit 1